MLVTKSEIDMKQPLKVILGHSFWNQLQVSCIIMQALSQKFPYKEPPKTLKIVVIDNPTIVWHPTQGNLCEYPQTPYISRN